MNSKAIKLPDFMDDTKTGARGLHGVKIIKNKIKKQNEREKLIR